MANEKFKVKFGLAVGDTSATIDSTTGNIVTAGTLDVQGGTITDSTGALSITTGAGNGDITLDPNGSGQTIVNSALDVNGNITGDLLQIDNIQIDANSILTTNTDGNLLLDPDGTGQVHLVTSSTQIGTGSANAQITTSGAHNMTLSTNNGNNSGTITIANGIAGNITIEPNTTGDIILGSDTVYVGDSGAAATITTNGNASLTIANGSGGSNNIVIDPTSGTTVNDGNLILGQLNTDVILNTNGTGDLDIRTGSWPTSANIKLNDGVNGDVVVDTDGTGEIDLNAPVNITGKTSIGGTLTTIGANNLVLNTNNGTNSGQIQITQGLDGNISIEPSGIGFIQAGAANTSTTVTTSGTGNLTLNTNFGTNAGSITLANGAFTSTGSSISGTTLTIGTLVSGTIGVGQSIHGGTVLTNTVITANISGTGSGSTWTVSKSQTVASSSLTGAGNITLAPNTTGDIALTLNNGGNLINSRNYVFGEIRSAATEALGDIWALNTTGTVQPFRGISIDNSADTTKLPGYIARSYSNTAGFRGRLVFERARGTAASPSAVQAGDFLGEVSVTGYSSTGWLNDNIITGGGVPGFFGFTAGENWERVPKVKILKGDPA